jgi:hypothetical protein
VSLLVAAKPELVFSHSASQRKVCAARVETLRAGLPNVDVDALVTEDPDVLLVDVSAGLRELRALWPLDVLHACDLAELGLAIRSMSGAGPPQKM